MKNVLITGGSRGIGAAAVREFSKAGCRVFFTYRSSHEEAERLEATAGRSGSGESRTQGVG